MLYIYKGILTFLWPQYILYCLYIVVISENTASSTSSKESIKKKYGLLQKFSSELKFTTHGQYKLWKITCKYYACHVSHVNISKCYYVKPVKMKKWKHLGELVDVHNLLQFPFRSYLRVFKKKPNILNGGSDKTVLSYPWNIPNWSPI